VNTTTHVTHPARVTPRWSLHDVSYRPDGGTRDIVDRVTLDVTPGVMAAFLGPNGAGKTTLLRMILGVIAPTRGAIAFGDRAIGEWDRREFARVVGVVAQSEADPLFSVREIVAMGRYPHLGAWQRERDLDRDAIDRAMERCDVAQFADRWITTLSGGEQQRVRLARALAQEPSVLVLDEPTTSLDIRHEMTTFELLRGLRADGVTIVMATHNLNLAARFADELVLMHEGRVIAQGAPMDVMTATQLESAYSWPVEISAHADGAPQVTPRATRGSQ